MKLLKKFNSKRGFTLAELVIVVAIIAILAGIAVTFINPKDISYVENNRSAEAIATAVQNRLTEIRNSGNMEILRRMGEQYVSNTGAAKAEVPSGDGSGETPGDTSKDLGGYRYVFNYNESGGAIERNSLISYILPFGAIDYDLAQNFYAIGFQSDTGMVGEVFYSTMPFAGHSASYLLTISGDSEQAKQKRKAENVGYYQGTKYEEEVAFANLPTPQLTITNYETLTLSIYLPEVKQLEESGKNLGILVSLSDKNGDAYKGDAEKEGLTLFQTAIYSTFSSNNFSKADSTPQPVVITQNISSGETYNIILDIVQDCDESLMQKEFDKVHKFPRGKFEQWAKKSGAFGDYFKLGDNNEITVTVYCLDGKFPEGVTSDETVKIDPTYLPRSASLIFNGWFNNYNGSSTVEIACGRHLQNLGKLSELREKLVNFAPKAKDTNGDGIYEYEKYDRGMADAYTEGSSEIDPHIHEFVKDPKESDGSKYHLDEESGYLVGENGVPLLDVNGNKVKNYTIDEKSHYLLDEKGEKIPDPLYKSEKDKNLYYDDITEKYVYCSDVLNSIKKAKQVNAIDFNCAEWKEDGKPIPFTPINLPYDFYYYGNYLTIKNLYVNAPFYAGLFGYVYHPRLYDILLVNPSVTSQMPANLAEIFEMGVGGLIGTSRDSSHINNCQVYMTPEGGKYNLDKRVQGECYVGGLIGFCEDEHIENCSASVYTGYAKDAASSSHYVGGLIGCITGDSEIKNCYAAGNLSGGYVGGLVGYILEDSDPSGDDYRITTCYTAGHIEYAEVEAAGLIGRIIERAGNVKSALSAYGNYCVVIYGEKVEGDYKWNSGVPIYGTFKGDGFEWMGTDDGGYYDVYLKGEFGEHSYFAGAVFENNSKNYYIAQRGIDYSGTSYLHIDGIEGNTVQDIINEIDAAKNDETKLKEEIADAQNKMYYLKKLQALEELKSFMEEVIKAVKNEPSTNANGTRYVEDHLVGLEVKGVEIHSGTSGYIKVTATQAIRAIYDGTFTDADGNSYTNQAITYEGSSHDTWLKDKSGIDTYTFMGFYNALKNAYKTLMNTPKDDNALKMVTRILGEDTGDTSKKFYQDGLFYQIFRTRLFYKLFNTIKDYYEDKAIDKNGELIFRHYRDDYADSGFRRLLCDLGMTAKGRENMLNGAKIKELKPVLDALKDYPQIVDLWEKNTDSPMKGTDASGKTYAAAIKALASTAQDKVKTLYEDLGKADCTLKKLQEDIEAADKALSALYEYFDLTPVDKDKDGKTDKDKDGNSIYVKDLKDAIDKNGKTGDMRNLRDPLNTYRRAVYLCGATSNSGVDKELDLLKKKLDEGGWGNTTTLVEEFVKNAQSQLNNDSGHRLKNATELRNAARGYVNGDDTETRDKETLGFMYDYGNKYYVDKKDINPYTNSGNPVPDGSYVDKKENGIYNNVFPYEENQFTKYYPFPFVYGRDVETTEERVLYVLFHYGDWLTEDLWAAPTITYHTDYPTMEGFSGEDIELSQYRVTNVNSFAPDEDIITSNDENIEIPFYFEGWYVDEDKTIPYSEEFKKSIEAAAINGEEKNFDLYAKWTVKPSLTFYAADLEGSYNGRAIPIDTTMTLTSGGKSITSEKTNSYSYQQFTVWFNPGQDVSLSVSGHYSFWGYEERGPQFTGGSEIYYIIDRLKVVESTLATGAAWYGEENIDRELGTVTFKVPGDAKDSDKYEITLSADGNESGSSFNICLAEGTAIRMADGSTKAVEDLEVGDIVLAFNHLTGKYEPTTVWITPHKDLESKLYKVTTLNFSDGLSLKIVGEHGLFDCTLNKYAFINETNYIDFIGHKFSAVTASSSGFGGREVTLVNASISYEMTKIYSPITENHLNIVAEDLLTVTSMMGYGDAVMNIFDYEPDMSYDKIQMAADIDKYGVYSYEDFADMLPQEVYAKVPLKVMKVAVGKGLISYEEVKQIIEYIYKNGYLS